MREQLLAELHGWERRLTLPSINEAIRLLESDKFPKLTNEHVQHIGEYRAIAIEEETFFQKAFTTGKEVAACLAYALALDREAVLDDMTRLRLAVRGPDSACLNAA